MKYKVYKITTKDGLVYIGQTCNLRKRVREHANTKPELKIGFDVEVLFEFDSREESLAKERELVNEDFIRILYSDANDNECSSWWWRYAPCGWHEILPEHSRKTEEI